MKKNIIPMDIENHNSKKQRHGYQEWYSNNGDLWYRGSYKNDQEVSYNEINYTLNKSIGGEGTEVNFYIK